MGKNELAYALQTARQLRAANIATEVYADEAKMKKQMTFANNKQIPFVVIIGEDELSSGLLTLKNMETGEQQKLNLEEVMKTFK